MAAPRPEEPGISVGVIVSTYNQPRALRAVLGSFACQTHPHFSITVADDGSTDETRSVVEAFSESWAGSVRHVWHEDEGFRLSAIRNRGAAAAEVDYLIFVDGDCLVRPDFVAGHSRIAQSGFFVSGSRVRLNQGLTTEVFEVGLECQFWGLSRWVRERIRGRLDRVSPLMRLPLGPLRRLGSSDWDGAKGGNFAVWRDDLIAVNGFDERFAGWGSEDNDLAVRLLRNGVRKKLGRYSVPVLHLWHPQLERSPETTRLFEDTLASDRVRVEKGIDQYL